MAGNIRKILLQELQKCNSLFVLDKTEFVPNFERYCGYIIKYLEKLAESLKNKPHRQLYDDDWTVLEETALRSAVIVIDEKSVSSYHLAASLFRCLRNVCADCLANQNAIVRSNLFESSMKIFHYVLNRGLESQQKDEVIVALRCGLQYFGNLVVRNDRTKEIIWKIFHLELDVFRTLLCHPDEKVGAYCSFVLYNCMTPRHRKEALASPGLLSMLAKQLEKCDSEWSLCCLEYFLQADNFMREVYLEIPMEDRLIILDVVAEQLGRTNGNALHQSSVAEMSRLFKNSALNVVIEMPSKEVLQVYKLLTALCIASSLDTYLYVLQDDGELLEVALDVLKMIHFLGKSGNGKFSPMSSIQDDPPELDPTHGIKCNLIRLVGNLAHRCRKNQDAIRELDGIPLLLDCCRMDAKNPFIIQWCVLAVRNMMEENGENQATLAAMTVTGGLADSSLMRELGLRVTPDGKVRING